MDVSGIDHGSWPPKVDLGSVQSPVYYPFYIGDHNNLVGGLNMFEYQKPYKKNYPFPRFLNLKNQILGISCEATSGDSVGRSHRPPV